MSRVDWRGWDATKAGANDSIKRRHKWLGAPFLRHNLERFAPQICSPTPSSHPTFPTSLPSPPVPSRQEPLRLLPPGASHAPLASSSCSLPQNTKTPPPSAQFARKGAASSSDSPPKPERFLNFVVLTIDHMFLADNSPDSFKCNFGSSFGHDWRDLSSVSCFTPCTCVAIRWSIEWQHRAACQKDVACERAARNGGRDEPLRP